MSDLHKKPGDVLKATDWNDLVDATQINTDAPFGFASKGNLLYRKSPLRIITKPIWLHSFTEFKSLFLAKIETLSPGPNGGLQCRIFMPDADIALSAETTPRQIDETYWITPPETMIEVAYNKTGDGTFGDNHSLQPDLAIGDIIWVKGELALNKSITARGTASFNILGKGDGHKTVWTGTLDARPHPGALSAYVWRASDPFGNNQKGTVSQAMTTAYYYLPVDGDDDDNSWKLILYGNRPDTSEDPETAKSYVCVRGDFTYRIEWEEPPQKEDTVAIFWEEENNWHYTAITTFSTPTPKGTIVMWTNAAGGTDACTAQPPPGWQLCDGSATPDGWLTPDMRGRFVVGYDDRTGEALPPHSDEYDVCSVAGEKWHGFDTVAGLNHNNHADHGIGTFTSDWEGEWALTSPMDGPNPDTRVGAQHSLTDNRPPFYVVAYIIKL